MDDMMTKVNQKIEQLFNNIDSNNKNVNNTQDKLIS